MGSGYNRRGRLLPEQADALSHSIRVGIDYTAGLNQRAGIGRLTRQLFTALFEADQETDYRLLYSPSATTDASAIPHQANVRAKATPLSERWQTIAWNRLNVPMWADVLAGGVDVFHSPDFALAPTLKAATVVTIHDLTFVVRPECAAPSLRAYLSKVVPRAAQRADKVVADSQATADDLARLYHVSPTKTEVIYSAADARFHPIPKSEAEELLNGLDIPRPFILTAGTLQPRKNLGRLLDAFASLDLPHHLVIVGARGWLYDDLLPRLQESHVIAPGHVDDNQLVALYNLADFFICPSLYEGFGLPPLEAMACGTPVAASNTSSLPEVVGEAGLTFDPEDTSAIAAAMKRLASESSLRGELAEAGLARSQRFSWRTRRCSSRPFRRCRSC